jgi:hypothetical protein
MNTCSIVDCVFQNIINPVVYPVANWSYGCAVTYAPGGTLLMRNCNATNVSNSIFPYPDSVDSISDTAPGYVSVHGCRFQTTSASPNAPGFQSRVYIDFRCKYCE